MRVRTLRSAAFAFALATAYNSAVAVRENLPGKPLGITVPLSVRTGILAGWGAAVAAPWPMPLAALVVTTPSRAPRRSTRGLVCLGIGIAGIVGLLIEPNTYERRSWTRPTQRAALLHLCTCIGLCVTGASTLIRAADVSLSP